MVAMVDMGCVRTTYGLCVCCEGGGATCGGHGVNVDYLWAMCVL